MDLLIQKLKKSPNIFLIRKNFKLYISEMDIDFEDIIQKDLQEEQEILYELKGSILETLNYYLFQRVVCQRQAFSIYQDIYYKKNKHLNGIRDDQVEMKLFIRKVSQILVSNSSAIHRSMIGSDDLLLIISGQINTNDVWKQEGDFKMRVISPFFIEDMLYVAYSKIDISNEYNKRQIVCNDCNYSQNKSKNIDLTEQNKQLESLKIHMVIQQINISFDYDITCGCCPDIFPFQDEEQFYDPIEICYSHIKFERIVLSGSIMMHNNNRFKVEVQVDKYLKSLTVVDSLYKYLKFGTLNDCYLNRMSIKFEILNDFYLNRMSLTPLSLPILPISEISLECNQESLHFVDYQSVLNYCTLIRLIQLDKNITNGKSVQPLQIINFKYVTQLTLILTYKLFQGQFSAFRLLYDLYEQF